MTVYAQTARFDSARALTEEELYKLAPGIFAREAHHSRSDRFAPIPTIEMVRALAKENFSVVGATQAVARIADRTPYTKHLLRLRRLDDAKKHSVGDTVFEILLRNGNDGSSQYNLLGGLFRICCLNSLVAKTATLDQVSVRHTGQAIDKVIEGTYRVLNTAEQLLAAPQDWSRVTLDRDERLAYATTARSIRYDEGTHVRPEQLLDARRREDVGNDLWRTFNVAQENMMKGGIHTVGRDANNRLRNGTTRPVGGIDQTVKVNQLLFEFTSHLARLRGAEAVAA